MNVFELAAKLTLDTSEYESGLSGAEQKAQGLGGALGGKLGTAAKVGGAAIAAVGTAAVAAAGAIASGVSSLAEYGDNIDKASQKMGLSAEAYQEWDAILQHSGTSIDAMSRGMTTLSKAAESNSDAFAQLGITQEELASMNQEELFARTIEGLQGMEAGSERTVLAQKLLGGSAKELGALLNTSAEDTEKMRQRVHELGGVMSDEAVKDAAAYQDALQDLQTTIKGAKNQLLANFLPAITQVMDGLTMIFSGESGGIDRIQEGISTFTSKMAEKLPQFVAAAGQILTSAVTELGKNLPTLMQSLVDSIVTLLPILIQGAIQLVAGLVAALPQIISGLIAAIPQILSAIAEGFAPIVSDLGALFGQAFDAIKEVFSPIGEWFTARKEDVQNAFAAVDSWFSEKFAAASDAVHNAWSAIGSWFSERWSEISNAFSSADSWFSEKFAAASDAVHTAWTGIGSWFSEKWTEIQNVFGDAWSIFSGIGGQIVQGLIAGITSWIGNAMETARNLIRSVKGAANEEAEVNSPSRVFRRLGHALDEGLMLGIDDEAEGPIAAMRNLMQGITSASSDMGANFALMRPTASGQSDMTGRGGRYGGVSIIVNAAKGQSEESIAERVERKLAQALSQREAVWA